MADDKRTYDLTAITASELSSLLSTLELDIDDPSFSAGESKRLALSLLLSSGLVAEGSTIEHLALTPKGFALSVATSSRNGIVKTADASDISSGTSGKMVDAAQLKSSVDAALQIPSIQFMLWGGVSSSGVASSPYGGSLTFTSSKLSTGQYQVNHNLGSSTYFVFPWITRTNTVSNQNKIGGIYKSDNYFKIDTGDDSSPNDAAFDFVLFKII